MQANTSITIGSTVVDRGRIKSQIRGETMHKRHCGASGNYCNAIAHKTKQSRQPNERRTAEMNSEDIASRSEINEIN